MGGRTAAGIYHVGDRQLRKEHRRYKGPADRTAVSAPPPPPPLLPAQNSHPASSVTAMRRGGTTSQAKADKALPLKAIPSSAPQTRHGAASAADEERR
jgi:hypothetical protein